MLRMVSVLSEILNRLDKTTSAVKVRQTHGGQRMTDHII
jgi:hypothetical protein